MKSFLIYALKEPTGEIRYFGKTCRSMEKRFSAHLTCKGEQHVARWVRSLLAAGAVPAIEVLISGLTNEEGIEEEIAVIAWGRAKGLRLTNLTDGGDGRLGFVVSAETRRKISEWHQGRPVSDETRRKLSDLNTGKVLSQEHRDKIASSVPRGSDHVWFGKRRSEETRAKISKSLTGKKQSLEQVENRRAAMQRGDNHWTRRLGRTPETRKRMSEAAIRRYERESNKQST